MHTYSTQADAYKLSSQIEIRAIYHSTYIHAYIHTCTYIQYASGCIPTIFQIEIGATDHSTYIHAYIHTHIHTYSTQADAYRRSSRSKSERSTVVQTSVSSLSIPMRMRYCSPQAPTWRWLEGSGKAHHTYM
jgi:hypothetical protein